jgi:hypothetical protein
MAVVLFLLVAAVTSAERCVRRTVQAGSAARHVPYGDCSAAAAAGGGTARGVARRHDPAAGRGVLCAAHHARRAQGIPPLCEWHVALCAVNAVAAVPSCAGVVEHIGCV